MVPRRRSVAAMQYTGAKSGRWLRSYLMKGGALQCSCCDKPTSISDESQANEEEEGCTTVPLPNTLYSLIVKELRPLMARVFNRGIPAAQ